MGFGLRAIRHQMVKCSQTTREQLCISFPNVTMKDLVLHPKMCTSSAVTNSALECLRNSCEDFDFGVNNVAWVKKLQDIAARMNMPLNCIALLRDTRKSGKNCNTLFRNFPSLYRYPNSIEAHLDKSTVNIKIAEICRLQCPCGSCSTTQTSYTCSAGDQAVGPASHAAPSLPKAMPILLAVASTLIQ